MLATLAASGVDGQAPTPTPPTSGIFPIRNGKLFSPLDANGFAIINYPGGLGGGGGGGGGLTSFTGDSGAVTGLTLANTGTLTDMVLQLGGTLNVAHGGTGVSSIAAFKSAAALDNLDNTSDLNKPISTATQTALNLKADSATLTSSLASFAGTTNVVTLGTVTTGTWNAAAIAAGKLPTLDGITVPANDVNFNSHRGTNLLDPLSATDIANKEYVDAVAATGPPHPAVAAATTANITLSAEQTIDGVTTSASRVLVKNQSTASGNGIYVSAAGAWSRASDANTGTSVSGSAFVTGGTVNAGSTWAVSTAQPITLGTTSIAYTQTAASTVYSAAGGLVLTGSQFSLASIPAHTYIGNNSGSTAAPSNVTIANLKIDAALNNVENTALSTWAGSTNITTLGTIGTGTIPLARLSPAPSMVGASVMGLATPASTSWISLSSLGVATTRTSAQVLGDIGGESALTFSPPLSRATNTISIPVATDTVNGYLSSTDHATFNGKVPPTRTIGTNAPLNGGGDLSANRTFGIDLATFTNGGYISASDYKKFASAAPVAATAGATGTYTINAAAQPAINRVYLVAVTTPGLNIDLPAASGYNAGDGIEIMDLTGTAMANYGVTVRRTGTDQVDGGTQVPLPRGTTYIKFASDGTSVWQSQKYNVNRIIDPNTPTKIFTFDASTQPTGQSPPFKVVASGSADSGTVADAPITNNTFTAGYSIATGKLINTPVHPAQLSPVEQELTWSGTEPVTGPGPAPAATPIPIVADGSIDSIKLTAPLSAPLYLLMPPVSAYNSGERISFRDLSNSITTTNFVRFLPNSGATINGTDHFDVTGTGSAGQGTFVIDGTGSVSTQGFSSSNSGSPDYSTLVESAGKLTWTIVPNKDAHVASGTMTGSDAIEFSGQPQPGNTFILSITQGGSGNYTLTLPTGSQTAAQGASIINVGQAVGAVTEIIGTYYGGSLGYLWHTTGLNYTGLTATTCSSNQRTYGLWSGTATIGYASGANGIYQSTGNYQPAATEDVCRIDIPIYYTTAIKPTQNLYCDVYADDGTGKPTGSAIKTSDVLLNSAITVTDVATALTSPLSFLFTNTMHFDSTQKYCIVVHTAAGLTGTATSGLGTTCHFNWADSGGQSSSFPTYRSGDGATWTNANLNTKADFKTYTH